MVCVGFTHMSDYDQLDLAILQTIDSIREKHNACTARSVAVALGATPDVVRYRLTKLANQSLVNWTEMPGSLVRLALPPLKVVESSDEEPKDSAPPSTSGAKRRRPPAK